ncbi:hypothetical protein C1H46_020667 [Malus baccata]|uniref:Kinesin motor domain-containing protein n=1 Tax=Malus baccata TaxID=106549 RepID=A0A540M4I2_MALBA|nr:hypothetical protein C1H46_020667 [Malus baccata]
MMPGTPTTPSAKLRRTPCSTPGGSKVREEKILVTVRLRPLNRREQAMYDLIAWDCLDEHTIVFKNPNHGQHSNPRQKGIFVLKFSALENYNETVVDHLKRKSGSLWLLDDSEKGTIVDKPQEEIVEKLANI